MNLLPQKEDKGGSSNGYDPYNISRNEDDIYSKARDNINIKIDKKTKEVFVWPQGHMKTMLYGVRA